MRRGMLSQSHHSSGMATKFLLWDHHCPPAPCKGVTTTNHGLTARRIVTQKLQYLRHKIPYNIWWAQRIQYPWSCGFPDKWLHTYITTAIAVSTIAHTVLHSIFLNEWFGQVPSTSECEKPHQLGGLLLFSPSCLNVICLPSAYKAWQCLIHPPITTGMQTAI